MSIQNDEVLRPSGPRRLVFAGEAIVDVVMRVPALPPRGGDVLAESSEVTAGGGFNVMAAAARLGLPVLYSGGHGTGPWGDLVRAALAAEGIGLFRPADPDRDTGFDVAFVESDAERTFVTHLGAEALRGPRAWDDVPVGPGDAVYVSGYGLVAPDTGPVLGEWAAALPSGPLLFVDPGPLVAQIPAAVLDPVLARCDWLSCNQREASLMSGTGPVLASTADAPGDPAAAARRLLARGAADGRGRRALRRVPRGPRRRRATARRRRPRERGRRLRGDPSGTRDLAHPGPARRLDCRRAGLVRPDPWRPSCSFRYRPGSLG
jgi:sugar/nucleoside kinase (ribokinase family)